MQQTATDIVKGSKMARFTHFRHNQLWYKTDEGFAFAVPVGDIGDATFLVEEKTLMMMRYIRQQLELNNRGMNERL